MKARAILLLGLLLYPWAVEARRAPQSLTEVLTRKLEQKLDEAMVAPPKDGEVCFTPGEPCDVKLWKFIRTAKTSLDVAVYDITHIKIVHELNAASLRIPVRILLDRRQSKGKHSDAHVLLKGKAQIRFGKQRGIMHHKFAIVDKSRLQTGSFNYTEGATHKNQENQVYLGDAAIVARFQERFDAMWDEGSPATSLAARR